MNEHNGAWGNDGEGANFRAPVHGANPPRWAVYDSELRTLTCPYCELTLPLSEWTLIEAGYELYFHFDDSASVRPGAIKVKSRISGFLNRRRLPPFLVDAARAAHPTAIIDGAHTADRET